MTNAERKTMVLRLLDMGRFDGLVVTRRLMPE
jgi:hypothetical protein